MKAEDLSGIGTLTAATTKKGEEDECTYDVQSPSGVLNMQVEYGPTLRAYRETIKGAGLEVRESDFDEYPSFTYCAQAESALACYRVIAVSVQHTLSIAMLRVGTSETQLTELIDQVARKALANMPPA